MCRILREYYLIKKSGLFDKQYYLNNNPDVLKANIDPLLHFLRFGWKEGRNPSKDIDLRNFLESEKGLFDVKTGHLSTLLKILKSIRNPNMRNSLHINGVANIEPEIIINNFNALQTEYINRSNMREYLIKSINLSSNKAKVFCIGLNKTGTTSMAKTLNDLGYIVGSQRLAELLLDDWGNRDFRSLINYCYTAQAFQDIPFSLPYSFQALDGYFPNSKFILTVRDYSEQWYNSLTQFHAKFFGKGKIPTINELKEADYIYPGYIYKLFTWTFNTPEEDPYNKNMLISNYEIYNAVVQDYFKFRPEVFLMINLSESDSYQKLCKFLGKPYHNETFPHENKTEDMKIVN
jgi:hypothetical protein